MVVFVSVESDVLTFFLLLNLNVRSTHTVMQGIIHPPPLLVVVNPPVDVNTHTQTVLPPLRLCVLF